MKLIEEAITNGVVVKYYSGFDLKRLAQHSKEGTDGVMVVFINSIKEEELKFTREEIILNLLEGKKMKKFSKVIDHLNNPYLAIYETNGFTDIIFKSIKYKLEVIRDYNFHLSNLIYKNSLNYNNG